MFRHSRKLLLVAVVAFFVLACTLHVSAEDVPPPSRTVDSGNDDNSGSNVFVPTQEWQEVPRGVHISPGLDVRLDIGQGKRFAKLPDGPAGEQMAIQARAQRAVDAASARLSGAAGDVTAAGQAPAAKPYSRASSHASDESDAGSLDGADATERMRDILLGLPQPEQELVGAVQGGLTGERLQEVVKRVWARRQAELKRVMAAAQTEGQQMQGALARALEAGSSDDAVRSALLDLEYHVSSAHNAADFRNSGGIAALTPLLNHSSMPVRAAAAWALGSAVKYSPPSQEAAAAAGAPASLAATLADSDRLAHAAVQACLPRDGSPTTLQLQRECFMQQLEPVARAAYALGALVRGGPANALAATVAANAHGAAASSAASLARHARLAAAQGHEGAAGPLRAAAIKCLAVVGDLRSALRRAAMDDDTATANSNSSGGQQRAEVLSSGAVLHSEDEASQASAGDAAAASLAQGALTASFRSEASGCDAALLVLAAAGDEADEAGRQELLRRAVRAVSDLPAPCLAALTRAGKAGANDNDTDEREGVLGAAVAALKQHRETLRQVADTALLQGESLDADGGLEDVGEVREPETMEEEAAQEAEAEAALRQYEMAAAAADAAANMAVVDRLLRRLSPTNA